MHLTTNLRILLALLIISFSTSVSSQITKPEVFEFGNSIKEISEAITPLCDSFNIRTISPIELPTAKTSQKQIDCYGFEYSGEKRKAELVFADDQLDLIWILTNENEENSFISEFKKLYGEPSHIKPDVTFFLSNGTAVRNQPHEVLFISDRLKDPFGQWLSSMP